MESDKIFPEYHNLSLSEFYNNELHSFMQQYYRKDPFLSLVDGEYTALNDHYVSYQIKKRNGSLREINAPKFNLKVVQRRFADYLLWNRKTDLNVSHGFELKRNISTGASKHVGKEVVINIDIKDFFQSINKTMIENAVLEKFPYTKEIENIVELVSYKNHLPTGAPTSPVISNYVCEKLDLDLIKFCYENNLTYTRYADDLTFSTNQKMHYKTLVNKISKILDQYEFKLNEKKTKIYKKSYRQEVTGLVVNEKVNLTREFRYNLKALFFNWETKGYKYASNHFNIKYPYNQNFITTVRGWVEFVGLVKGKKSEEYLLYSTKMKQLMKLKN